MDNDNKITYAVLFTYHYNPNVPEDVRNQGVTLAPGDHVLLKIDCPKDGKIKKLIINIPPGCTNKVKFRLFVNQDQIFPAVGWFGFEGFIGIIEVNYPVRKGDKLYMEAINRGVNEHFISVTEIIE